MAYIQYRPYYLHELQEECTTVLGIGHSSGSVTMLLLLLRVNPCHIIGNLVQLDPEDLFLCTLRG